MKENVFNITATNIVAPCENNFFLFFNIRLKESTIRIAI